MLIGQHKRGVRHHLRMRGGKQINKQTKKTHIYSAMAELTAAAKAAVCKAMDGLRGGRQTSAAAWMRAGQWCVVVLTTEGGKEGADQT